MSGRDPDRLASVAGPLGLATESDWRALIERPDVQVVDICTPPGAHLEAIAAAVAAGKDVVCEKPLTNPRRGPVGSRGRCRSRYPPCSGFNYRRLPALALMAELSPWRARCGEAVSRDLASDEFVDAAIPFDWRFERAWGGTTIADLGSHLVDLATSWSGQWLASAPTRQLFIERSTASGLRAVDVDDASSALLRFVGGARGTLEVARVAPRRPCDFVLEVNGDRGTAVFDYARLNELWVGSTRDDPHLYGLRRCAPSTESSRDCGLVADRPRHRLRRQPHQSGGRPCRRLEGA